MKQLINFLFLYLMLFCCSCTTVPDVEVLIEQEVENRLEKFRKQKRKECMEFIVWDAERKVDSVMYLEMGTTFKKPFAVPLKPARPEDSLTYVVELDTERVDAFLPDSVRFDTLDWE